MSYQQEGWKRRVVGEDQEKMLNSMASWYGGIAVSEMIDCACDRRLLTDTITNAHSMDCRN